MYRYLFATCLLLYVPLVLASAMKLEGTCQGLNVDGGPVSFNFYSAFEGCHHTSAAAIVFKQQTGPGKLKGIRSLVNGLDRYAFQETYWLIFPDSTGNTQGEFKYRSSSGEIKSITLQCEIRDYTYESC